MLVIQQNSINKLVVTLFEEDVLTDNLIYLFEFINLTTNGYFYCVASDKSKSPYRHNDFCITETGPSGSTDPYNAQVNLPLPGQYLYNIYENPLSVLSPAGLNLVESGKVRVVGVTTPANSFQSSVNPNLVAYNSKIFNS
jgi:hypothetical protein